MRFKLTSPSFKDGDVVPTKQLFSGMGQQGENLSPALKWEGAPDSTRSFALTLYDPDAPTGSGWWHWVVADLPATVSEIAEGASSQNGLLAPARQFRNDFGAAYYGGAAPPPGIKHRYIFTVKAIDVACLDVPDDASAAYVGFMANKHLLAAATLTLVFQTHH